MGYVKYTEEQRKKIREATTPNKLKELSKQWGVKFSTLRSYRWYINSKGKKRSKPKKPVPDTVQEGMVTKVGGIKVRLILNGCSVQELSLEDNTLTYKISKQ